jgi:hypothetical protein
VNPLGDYTNEAWHRVGRLLFGNNYEEISGYDYHLTEQYRDPGPSRPFSGGYRTFAPSELIRDVSRAYFRLDQFHKIEAWFEARGFDLDKSISKEEFEKLLNGQAEPLPLFSKSMIKDHVHDFVTSCRAASPAIHPTQDACVAAWKDKHGDVARKRVRAAFNTYAKDHGIEVKEGRPRKPAE